MDRKEIKELAKLVAESTAEIVVKRMKEIRGVTDAELVDVNEAARILGVTPNYLRQKKEKYAYVKSGDKQQGRLMFRRDLLLREFNL